MEQVLGHICDNPAFAFNFKTLLLKIFQKHMYNLSVFSISN